MTKPSKKQKLAKEEGQKRQLVLNVLIPGSPAVWRNPADRSKDFTNSLDPWVELAEIAESGKLHAIFIADHLTFFDAYKGPFNYKPPLQTGVYSPRVDPSAAVSAMALKTHSIGFGITFSTVSEHPYLLARRLATLDHFTKGRVGWNVVASYLESVGRQLLNGAPLPEHDERYEKSEEYLNVVYQLLLSSWRDDALVYDKENAVFADPERVKEINHVGKYFNVPGPAITEPSPQRFPVIIQAGASKSGKLFAAKHAEVLFVDGRVPEAMAKDIKEIRRLAKEVYNRDPNSLIFLAGANPIIGRTHQEALDKATKLKSYAIPEAAEVAWGGISGMDLSKYELDDEVTFGGTNGLRTITENVINRAKGPTKRDILDSYRSRIGNLVGSPEEVADEIERWVKEYDVDGFNLGVSEFPGSVKDIVELLVPELQKRGLFQKEYTVKNGTYRENVFGIKGQTFLKKDHPAYNLRWTEDQSQDEIEQHVEAYKNKK